MFDWMFGDQDVDCVGFDFECFDQCCCYGCYGFVFFFDVVFFEQVYFNDWYGVVFFYGFLFDELYGDVVQVLEVCYDVVVWFYCYGFGDVVVYYEVVGWQFFVQFVQDIDQYGDGFGGMIEYGGGSVYGDDFVVFFYYYVECVQVDIFDIVGVVVVDKVC